jgi:hypothetical protein
MPKKQKPFTHEEKDLIIESNAIGIKATALSRQMKRTIIHLLQ